MDDMLESVIKGLAKDRSRWERISVDAGVPIATTIKVGKRHTRNPRIQTVMRLSKALKKAGLI